MRVKVSGSASLLVLAGLLICGGCSNKTGTDAGAASIPSQNGQSADGKKDLAGQPSPEVVLDTTSGPITIRLKADKSPKTVANFLDYVKSNFYDRTIFHQVYKNQGLIGGAYAEDMTVKSAKNPIRNEANNGLKNERYTVAMLRDPESEDSATSVFLINVVDNPSLDFTSRTPEGYGYCVFGQVIQGMDIVDRIAAAEVHDIENLPCTPKQPIVIKSARQIK